MLAVLCVRAVGGAGCGVSLDAECLGSRSDYGGVGGCLILGVYRLPGWA